MLGLKLNSCAYTLQASFFPYITSIFVNYLTLFQSDAPLVPFLFDALEMIFFRSLGLIYKEDSMAASRDTSKMLKKD